MSAAGGGSTAVMVETGLESRVESAFDRLADEGEERLDRSWAALVSTGLMGGVDVVFGVLALLLVLHETGNHLLAGLAFGVGFVALLLADSELFTEGFLVPVTALAAKRARARQLVRLWAVTLAANIAGGWCMAWLVAHAFPSLHATAVEAARVYATSAYGARSICLGLLAGAAITLMTRMQHGTESDPAKLVAAVAGAFVLAGASLFHSILDSLLCFVALTGGRAPFGYGDWAHWFVLTVVTNMAGGLGLVTLLRLVRSKEKVQAERSRAEAPGNGD